MPATSKKSGHNYSTDGEMAGKCWDSCLTEAVHWDLHGTTEENHQKAD